MGRWSWLKESVKVLYGPERWRLFEELRAEAAVMMHPFLTNNINAICYGSIARGDVSKDSDIDVFLPRPPSPTIVEAILERLMVSVVEREIVQATPSYSAKGYIYLGERRSYSFPMVEMKTVELEFYGFAGSVTAHQVANEIRIPGVDKRLMLIEPSEEGHTESTIIGREGSAAKLLGINVATVLDRIRTLRRREKIGRTGVFLKRKLSPEESFGEVFHELSRSRPAMRRRMRISHKT